MTPLKPYDLSLLADNGLRRGRTTGSCAAGAVKAALLLLQGVQVSQVDVALPDGEHFLSVPIESAELVDGGVAGSGARASVIKDGGDDPDATHGATLWAEVRPNGGGPLRFLAGEGVGTITAPGLQLPIGEAAINPVPRRMLAQVVEDLTGEAAGFDLTVGCLNGEAIARKTFNPRLGILGGISILGTTGIVEPMSLEAYMASVEVYIRVALGPRPERLALTPGKLGRDFARGLGVGERQIIQMSNFVGFALDAAQRSLSEDDWELPHLLIAGHPAKLAKVLNDDWDTHSQRSGMAMGVLAGVAERGGWQEASAAMRAANTVEEITTTFPRPDFWREVEGQVARRMHARVPRVRELSVRLFAMSGAALGEASLGGAA
ncbi:cobalt-precorrin-5B (C(1))-methyltransferase CbiD [Deinococcus arenicola]|uniref:Cobalt-precorrin-5B C(1)-methyltransferase n=1 Tax=Deinococcus arenicola TaxID=2994950 RepID=A0ABU4DV30_9DEIO|nr:cobalt-precorrin-5B (C(1))-methyltransferase CbiD [Deinococcus sp. ZS9-10]MDV6375740.1 cobalt-precorrin-5B (C(1))-methyltransferase CbiD [Deinococcus sp. ZS9-10]